MNRFDDTLNCVHCHKLLNQPVILPCGHSICNEHEKAILASRKENSNEKMNNEQENIDCVILCKECNVSYKIPECGFIRNISVEKLIERKLHNLYLGDDHNAAVKSCERLESLIEQIRPYCENTELEINKVIGELKNKVDLKREEMKKWIDDEALRLIEKLDNFESECKRKNPQSSDELKTSLKKAKEELKLYKKELTLFEKNITKWKKIKESSDSASKNLDELFLIFKDELFCNKLKEYEVMQLNFSRHGKGFLKKLVYTINNAKQLKNSNDHKHFKSNSTDEFDIKWSIQVEIDNDKDKKVGVFLKAQPKRENYKVTVEYSLDILDKNNPINRNYLDTRKFEYTYEANDLGRGTRNLISLSNLLSNDGLYDENQDFFIAQATIHKIEWVKD